MRTKLQEHTLHKLAKGSTYKEFLKNTEKTGLPLLYRGMAEGDELEDGVFMAEYLGHAYEYAEDDNVDGIAYDRKDLLFFDEKGFEQMRSFYRKNPNELKVAYKNTHDRFIDDPKVGMSFVKSDKPFTWDYSRQFELTNALVPAMVHYARSLGANIVGFMGGDYADWGGQEEYVVDDISKYNTLRSIWREANGEE